MHRCHPRGRLEANQSNLIIRTLGVELEMTARNFPNYALGALVAAVLATNVASAQVNEIASATGTFTPSFRGTPNTSWIGWDTFDDAGAQTLIINDSTPDVGTSFNGSFVTNNGEAHISGSLNIYTGPGTLDETVTFPTDGAIGSGFTTIIIQGHTLFGPFGLPIQFSNLGGVAPVEVVTGPNAMGFDQFWVKYEITGNDAQYMVDLTTAMANSFISLDIVEIDTFWSPTGFAPDTAVVELPAVFDSICNGDGGDQMGCTECPCGNNAPKGTIGGCMNSAGSSTQLVGSGSRSVMAADLRFQAIGAPALTTAVLTSSTALAPANAANPCFGLNSGVQSISLDGLRCAVQNVLRHGVRPSDVNGEIGVTTNGWGEPNGFFNFSAFVAGNTRHFQIIHRDENTQVCGTGQNSSQAISVTFEM